MAPLGKFLAPNYSFFMGKFASQALADAMIADPYRRNKFNSRTELRAGPEIMPRSSCTRSIQPEFSSTDKALWSRLWRAWAVAFLQQMSDCRWNSILPAVRISSPREHRSSLAF